jgi:hypothetical protein
MTHHESKVRRRKETRQSKNKCEEKERKKNSKGAGHINKKRGRKETRGTPRFRL